ncbi:hypothetical protein NEOLI_001283 [Neolecta irregularis DAH-3]|uniref:DNA mismatch repair protein Mlh1 C-terminal domain-containing protein n=1 Tax=Neolecta irregularis (strain DAH-3) TaxID=1198029 RepID=A0A1U7LK71_NEOID|nr:hypothetical protein NEOLI_001283 [Neolecta irregularis DAH-3]|eukprot:OLL23044.1 hypothetical protein NEOLI_001283 [Neolecta irregularis DAH-3]
MLNEYFSIEISEDGFLLTIPLLLKNYSPGLGKLPRFLHNLGSKVNWFDEKECFKDLIGELSLFYSPEPLPQPVPEAMEGRATDLRHSIEHALFPAFKKRLVATKRSQQERRVVEVADLPDLYKLSI